MEKYLYFHGIYCINNDIKSSKTERLRITPIGKRTVRKTNKTMLRAFLDFPIIFTWGPCCYPSVQARIQDFSQGGGKNVLPPPRLFFAPLELFCLKSQSSLNIIPFARKNNFINLSLNSITAN